MRTLTADMEESVRSQGATLARLWKFTRLDGTVLRITDHDENIKVSGDGTYRCNIGFSPTAVVSSSINFGSQQAEVKMVMTNDGLREADVRARRWNGASAVFSVVDWANPTSSLPMFAGSFGRITLNEKSMATIEVFGLGNKSIRLAGDVFSMTCRNSLGDHKCLVNIENLRLNFTVATVTDATSFVASDLRGQPDGYYAFGQLVWDTGLNAGDPAEIQTSINVTNEVGIFFPPTSPMQIGDTGHMYPGCDLLIPTCFGKFGNVVNFNGEPYNVQPNVIPAPVSSGSVAGA